MEIDNLFNWECCSKKDHNCNKEHIFKFAKIQDNLFSLKELVDCIYYWHYNEDYGEDCYSYIFGMKEVDTCQDQSHQANDEW